MKDKYVTTTQAAKLLNTNRVQIFRKIKSGEIPAERIGRNYIIERKNLPISKQVTNLEKENIKHAVKKVIAQYGDVLRKLGEE